PGFMFWIRAAEVGENRQDRLFEGSRHTLILVDPVAFPEVALQLILWQPQPAFGTGDGPLLLQAPQAFAGRRPGSTKAPQALAEADLVPDILQRAKLIDPAAHFFGRNIVTAEHLPHVGKEQLAAYLPDVRIR